FNHASSFLSNSIVFDRIQNARLLSQELSAEIGDNFRNGSLNKLGIVTILIIFQPNLLARSIKIA
ncbi:hypothetical protein WAJ71_21530, partial [Acinetobacter baumannii]